MMFFVIFFRRFNYNDHMLMLSKVFLMYDLLMQVIQREPWEHIKDEDIKKAAATFCGEIWQVPPMFSAIKVRILAVFKNDPC